MLHKLEEGNCFLGLLASEKGEQGMNEDLEFGFKTCPYQRRVVTSKRNDKELK